MSHLRIGVPSKGRLAEQTAELLTEAGLTFRRRERTLFALCRGMPVEVTFLRTGDIAVLCTEGAIDLGITGSDVVAESRADVEKRLNLGYGTCRLAVCVPEDSPARGTSDLAGKRVATSFPNLTREFLKRHADGVHVVSLSGSVEIMVALGVADAVVDLVDTGSTLAANRLRVLAEIGTYQTVLIQNRDRRKAEVADRVVRRLEGVVIARSWSLLEYNVLRSKLAEAEKITPGYDSPTVNALEDSERCAVQVLVKQAEVIEIMERLEALGASAILETRITNCRL